MGRLEATTEENCGTPRIPSADAAQTGADGSSTTAGEDIISGTE